MMWKYRSFSVLATAFLLVYGVLALSRALIPVEWAGAASAHEWAKPYVDWLMSSHGHAWLHPTAGWLAWIAAATLWMPTRHGKVVRLLPLIAGGVGLMLLPLLISYPQPRDPSFVHRLVWPHDARGWPIALIAVWLLAFVLVSCRPRPWTSRLAALVSYTMMTAAVFGVASHYLKLDLIYQQPLFAPVKISLAVMLFIFGLILLLRRQALVSSGDSREDSLISSIGLGLLVTIALSTGLSSFIALQSQVESSLYRGQIQSMDNRIIVFYNAMDAVFNELSAVTRNTEVSRLVAELDDPALEATDEKRRQLLEAAASNLPYNVGAYEFRSTTGKVLARKGEFLKAETVWLEYRDTTEMRLEWYKGVPFIGMTIRINDADKVKIGELVVELPTLDWEQLVSDTYELGRTGTMMICGINNELLRCLQSHGNRLYLPPENNTLTTMIQDALEGERSSPAAPEVTLDPDGKPVVVTYGPVSKVRVAIKAPGIGLAMLILTDAEEFYEPVRKQLQTIMPLLLFIIFVGGLVLRRLVLPLIRALREAQQGLEIRVAERTAELSASNDALAVEVQERTQAEARFRSLTELSSDWYWEMDTRNRFATISGEVERKGGFTAADSLGKALWEQSWVVHEENDWIELRRALEARAPFHEYTVKIRDFGGGVRYLAISGQPFHDADGNFVGFRGTGKDVTEKRLAEEHIHFLAHYDSLTTLPNRTFLNEKVKYAIERAKRNKNKVALLFIDLDRFKVINDSLGHDAGDEVLCIVGRRIVDCARKSDVVSRLGGDEFVVLLEDIVDANHAGSTARRILDLINEPFQLHGDPYTVGASIGISLFPDDGDSVSELLKHSDTAMYLAKKNGRNGIYFFSSALNENSMAIFRLESDLRQALEQEQFILHYQPKVNPVRDEIVGLEALIRWHHPTRGMVSPLEFIPMAEECGLIVAMGEWVLHKALAQLAEWDAAGLPPLTMAVNLSTRQLQDSLPDVLEAALRRHGLPGERLELELTESLMLQRPERDIRLLERIRNTGIRIALDDFGTGYSSLSSLASLPIDCIKMDRAFVERLPTDTTSAAISRSILTMARGIGLEIVAEGVENAQQWKWLAQEGCHQIQGYYFSKPLPPEQAFAFIAEFTRRSPDPNRA